MFIIQRKNIAQTQEKRTLNTVPFISRICRIDGTPNGKLTEFIRDSLRPQWDQIYGHPLTDAVSFPVLYRVCTSISPSLWKK